MSSFNNEFQRDNIHLKTNIHSHNWFAGDPRTSLEIGLRLLFQGRTYADECHDDWNKALRNIDGSSDLLAKSINRTIPYNGDVLVVGHSMGVEVTRRAISKIRDDIRVYLFLMGGVSSDTDYDEIFERENVPLAYNFYSENDLILNEILPNMDGDFVLPIGGMKCYNDKVCDVNINQGHSDYFQSRVVLDIYTSLVKRLIIKDKGKLLCFKS